MTENPSIVLHDESFQMLLAGEQIERRIAELGNKISEDYQGLHPVFIVVLNGAFMFAASLLKKIKGSCEVSFVRLASYQSKESTGDIYEALGISDVLAERHLIIVEDIVDTGLSMQFLLGKLRDKRPASVRIAALLLKPEAIQVKEVIPDYVGFEIGKRFVVGYGLDYDGLGRNYPDIYVNIEN